MPRLQHLTLQGELLEGPSSFANLARNVRGLRGLPAFTSLDLRLEVNSTCSVPVLQPEASKPLAVLRLVQLVITSAEQPLAARLRCNGEFSLPQEARLLRCCRPVWPACRCADIGDCHAAVYLVPHPASRGAAGTAAAADSQPAPPDLRQLHSVVWVRLMQSSAASVAEIILCTAGFAYACQAGPACCSMLQPPAVLCRELPSTVPNVESVAMVCCTALDANQLARLQRLRQACVPVPMSACWCLLAQSALLKLLRVSGTWTCAAQGAQTAPHGSPCLTSCAACTCSWPQSQACELLSRFEALSHVWLLGLASHALCQHAHSVADAPEQEHVCRGCCALLPRCTSWAATSSSLPPRERVSLRLLQHASC